MEVTGTCCNALIYDGKKIVYVLDHQGTVWIRSNEIADILLYSDNEDITQQVYADEHVQFHSLDRKIFSQQEEIQSETVFLSQSGIFNLVLQSRNPNKREIIRWIVNTVVPSIQKIDYKLKNDKLEELNNGWEIAKAENFGLRSEIKTKNLELNKQGGDARMLNRYVQLLREEKQASDAWLELQIKGAEALQHQIQVLIEKEKNKSEKEEADIIKIRNMKFTIEKLQKEIQSKDEALTLGNVEKSTMQSRIENLETRNRAMDETLEKYKKKTNIMHIEMLKFKNENTRLYLQTENQQDIQKRYGEVMRKQDVLLHLLQENFIPKPYDENQESQFLIFKLNIEDFYTYYAVSLQGPNISRQIKTIRAIYPHCVEILRFSFYPNAVDMFGLLKKFLKDKIQFTDNYFKIQDDEYTDDDLIKDFESLFNEAENTRREVFEMLCIERDFRSMENKCILENKCTPISEETKDNLYRAEEKDENIAGNEDEYNSFIDRESPVEAVEEDTSTFDSNSPPADLEDVYSEPDSDFSLYDIVPEAYA